MYAFTPSMELNANAAAVSSITALTSDFSQLWKVEDGTMKANAISALMAGVVGSGVDGTYARFGLFQIETTGDADLEIAITDAEKTEFSLLYNTESNVGLYYGTDNNLAASQTNVASSVIYNRVALRGTKAATETVVEGTGVYLAVKKDASAAETVSALPVSETYLTEWDSSYVELWLNTQDANVDIANVNVNLQYNTAAFTATGVEYSSLVNGLEVTIDDATGIITGIGGDLSNAVTNEDGFVLLARVKMESLEGDNVAADAVGSADMGLVLDQIAIQNTNGDLIDPNTKVYVNTKVFSVVYDADDNGKINLNDLISLAKLYGQSSVDSVDPRVWAMDFDNSGTINLNDLISFAKNYGAEKGVSQVQYPESFFQQWIGTTLEVSGDSNVADTLGAAIQSWEKALGEDLNVDVQIIVKDLDNADYVLGETVLVGLDENGAPNTAVVYLDSDALGMGWYVGDSEGVPAEQYDLYSTLLHELGHALGFNASYTGYTDLVADNYTYTDDAGTVHLLSTDGHSWEYADLMFPEIGTGTRKEVSALDAEIVGKARDNGGIITAQTRYTMTGNTANIQLASGIVDTAAWNATLVAAAALEIQRVEGATTDQAWAVLEGETVLEDETVLDSQTSVSLRAADAVEDFLADDEFESLLDEIATDDLELTL